MATPCTNSLGGESGGHRYEGCGGRSACWKFAAVSWAGAGGRRCRINHTHTFSLSVDVGPERRSPRYHETCLALESIKEGSAAVSEPRRVRLRVHIFKDLEKARRLPVRVEEQQAQ